MLALLPHLLRVITPVPSKLLHGLDPTYAWQQVLKVFPYPMNITTVQFAVGTVVAFIMWITGILQRPKVSPAQVNIYVHNSFGGELALYT